MNISVLLLTKNEAGNLPRCLAALSRYDDIVVLDSGSTDETLDIAKTYGVRILHRPFDNFASQRNFGLDVAGFSHEWILHLDADEEITESFAAKIEALVPPAGIDGYRIPSKTIFAGRWLKRAGMYPSYQVRLGHRDRLRFKQVGHGQREDLAPSRVETFDEPYLHYSFSHGLQRWLHKHCDYAADEARALVAARRQTVNWRDLVRPDRTARRRATKALSYRLPLFLRPFVRFIYVYVFRLGFTEGTAGFAYSFMLSLYEGMIAILAYEMRNAELSTSGAEFGDDLPDRSR